ncbi:MAG: hypothetical protein CL954_02585 [Erythrobacteraceae bacterium]|nr:hypothetical protein [Erythrobacteraceae bacterium]
MVQTAAAAHQTIFTGRQQLSLTYQLAARARWNRKIEEAVLPVVQDCSPKPGVVTHSPVKRRSIICLHGKAGIARPIALRPRTKAFVICPSILEFILRHQDIDKSGAQVITHF